MLRRKLLCFVAGSGAACLLGFCRPSGDKGQFLTYEVDLQKQSLKLYWKDNKGRNLQSLQGLKTWLGAQGQQLAFAANAGMFDVEHAPQGLFIQDFKVIKPLDENAGSGNFYLKPNGVFFLTAGDSAGICLTDKFPGRQCVKYATQSGPMLVIEGRIHPAFRVGSANLNIRNGVGILPNKHVVFVMSKQKVSLYAFADYFRKLGCRDALYLDGFVSRTYLPEQNWVQTDGDFGVMVGVAIPTR